MKRYIQASGSSTQLITANPQQIIIDTDDGSNKITLDGGVRITKAGEYLLIASPQVTSAGTTNFKCWIRVNGINVANSNVLMNVGENTKDVIISQGIISAYKGDVVTVWMSTDDLNKGVGIEAIKPYLEPLIPSIIFTMFEV